MTRSGARLAVASLLAVLVLGAASAYAAYPNTVKGAHRDCGAGHYPLHGHYSVSVLIKALSTLSTSAVEYTTCKDALERALHLAEQPPRKTKTTTPTTTHTTTTRTSTTHTSTTHTHRAASKPKRKPKGPTGGTGPISSKQIDAAVSNGKQPQNLDGTVYTPGAITTRNSSFISSIPDPILALLAALIAVLGGLGGLAVRNIVRARRTG
jgi:hypothetical protein